MQRENPIFRDLLQYVTKDELDTFMSHLKTFGFQKKLPVTLLTEVDQPVYCNKIYYHTVLCFAVAVNNPVMGKALLDIHVNPNITDLTTANGSALSIASHSKHPNASIMLQMLIATSSIDLYLIDAQGASVFSDANGSAAFVLGLLAFDPFVSMLTGEEKQFMSNTIAEATTQSVHKTNTAVCQTLKSVYLSDNEQKLVEDKIREVVPCITSGQPIGKIVLSYLFKRKPDSLELLEKRVSNNEPQEENKRQCRIL